jgi:hypothetical protein
MKRMGWNSVWVYVIAAGVFEGPEAPSTVPAEYQGFDWIAVLNLVLAGPAVAVAFWSIARPDRSDAVAELPSMGKPSKG